MEFGPFEAGSCAEAIKTSSCNSQVNKPMDVTAEIGLKDKV